VSIAVLLLVAWSSSAPAGPKAVSASDDAAAVEESAFLAVEAENWCEAMRLFERAYALAPADDLLSNAAQAGEYAGDWAAASVFLDALLQSPGVSKAKRAEAKKKRTELLRRATTSNTACPPLAARLSSPSIPTVESSKPPPAAPPAAPAPPSAVPMTTGPWAVWALGGGGVAVAAGTTATALGLTSWFAHAAAVEQIRTAERAREDATSLQRAQAVAREDWESWGQALTVAGGVVVSVGVAAAVVGAVEAVNGNPRE
jgi:hypothetical protein